MPVSIRCSPLPSRSRVSRMFVSDVLRSIVTRRPISSSMAQDGAEGREEGVVLLRRPDRHPEAIGEMGGPGKVADQDAPLVKPPENVAPRPIGPDQEEVRLAGKDRDPGEVLQPPQDPP